LVDAVLELSVPLPTTGASENTPAWTVVGRPMTNA